jgi:small-conductance mechanosensitive channel
MASKNPNVLKKPEPNVFFENFGDSSLDFTIAVWTDSSIDKPGQLKSQLYFEIFRQFAENGIGIPFPQRDIHIKTSITNQKLVPE